MSVINSELIRLKRPSFLLGATGITAVFSAIISVFVFTSIGTESAGPGPAMPTLEDLEGVGGFVASLGTISTLVGLVTLAFWAIAVASDYSTGLIRILVQGEPNRLRLLAGKVGALTLFTAVSTALATIIASIASILMAPTTDLSTAAWSTNWLTELGSAYINLTASALVWGVVGLLIAVLSRNSGVAIAVGIGYIMVVENLVGIVAESATDWLPGGTLAAVASGGTAALSYGTAMALAAIYAAGGLGIAAAAFHRRDITS